MPRASPPALFPCLSLLFPCASSLGKALSTPQLRGELAVTGWGASTWFSGTVTHIAAGRKGSDYTIYFKSDKRYIVTKLPAANYGPGSVGEATRKS